MTTSRANKRHGKMASMLAALGMGTIGDSMELPKGRTVYRHGKQSTWKTHREGGVCTAACFYCKGFSAARAR